MTSEVKANPLIHEVYGPHLRGYYYCLKGFVERSTIIAVSVIRVLALAINNGDFILADSNGAQASYVPQSPSYGGIAQFWWS